LTLDRKLEAKNKGCAFFNCIDGLDQALMGVSNSRDDFYSPELGGAVGVLNGGVE